MAQFYEMMKPKSKYYDKNNYSNQEEYDQALSVSSTVYVGNLNYLCSQDSIRQLFSRAGKVKRIIMGINNQGQRCGFCFVIFQTHEDAIRAIEYISQTKLDNKVIRVDIDPGYKEGREKGRGRDGNQKRDDFRSRNYEFRAADRSRNKYENRGNFERRNDKYNDGRNDGGREDRRGGRERYQRNQQYRDRDQDDYRERKAEKKQEPQKYEQQQY